MFVIAQRAAQQAQVVEGQDQDHHATKSNAANPPEGSRQSQTIRDLTEGAQFPLWFISTNCQSILKKESFASLAYPEKKHISIKTRVGTMKIEHKAY